MITNVVLIIVGIAYGFVFGYQFTEIITRSIDSKAALPKSLAYIFCVMGILTSAVVVGLVFSEAVKPGDEIAGRVVDYYSPAWSLNKRDTFIGNAFFTMIVPAIAATWLTLRERPKRGEP